MEHRLMQKNLHIILQPNVLKSVVEIAPLFILL